MKHDQRGGSRVSRLQLWLSAPKSSPSCSLAAADRCHRLRVAHRPPTLAFLFMKSDEREALTIARPEASFFPVPSCSAWTWISPDPGNSWRESLNSFPSFLHTSLRTKRSARHHVSIQEEHARSLSLSLSLSLSREIDRLREETFTSRRVAPRSIRSILMRANFHRRVPNKRGT